MQAIKKVFTIEDGRQIEIETGKLAKQADGSVVVRMGDTMLLATVCAKKEAGDNVDFMPLTVEYQEKYAAVGRFPGGFFKREARPSEYEILIARLVDRALRPLFPEDFHAEVQVQITLISGDQTTPPDALAALAASSALAVSDIPFNGPVSEVRITYIDGKFVINPSIEDLEKAELDLIVAATEDNIMMVEGEMKEVSEELMLEALKIAHQSIKTHCQAIKDLEQMANKTQKREYCHETNDKELQEKIHNATYQKCYDFAKQGIANKSERAEGFAAIKQAFIDTLTEEEASEKEFLISKYFHATEKEAMRDMVLNERVRLDGRRLDEIRPIWAEVDYLPTPHGSAIFTRGETQSLTTCTLGTKLDEQIIDGAMIEGKNNFILHYNFPGFATGEVKGNRGLSRREVGHGNLAMRALKQVLPTSEECPYTIRIVSDILESNGSSSMATVCAGCLALMDAGVQIKKPVSGIAMGLIAKDGKWAVLSDILGDEDHLGDMDFKVTGTVDGATACQMDIKCDGLSYEILTQALLQAKEGRMHILNIINETLPAPREDYKPQVPRVVKLTIPKEFIGAVIGPGGKIIQEMQKETKTTIVIEEKGEFGVIDIVSVNKEGIDAALARIKGITTVPEIGQEYDGEVKNLQTFGAFVEFLPGKDGLLHISELAWERVNNVEDVLKVGDKIKVKLIEVDKKTGKFKLSHRVLLPKPEGFVERPQRERPERPNNNRPNNNRNNAERPKPQKPERPLDEDFYI
ncbi:MAG: polyribonucleotide nucleotidyltransferase [Bacteroidales bacterium]|jgi:polyribonucleotide nucleotidyltransferase|nr:polyribonucleotide nucleotidyltransferase [Bacteroidales bacterium]MDX9799192.1 polyribonucleotide nucleotidyltransferase [Bacteroidales bacterium]